MIEWLRREFPGRVFFYSGSCLKVLPNLANRGERFDCFHIDGGKHTYFSDVLNCSRLADDGEALVIIDDMQIHKVQRMWSRCVRYGVLSASERFPIMPVEIEFPHASES